MTNRSTQDVNEQKDRFVTDLMEKLFNDGDFHAVCMDHADLIIGEDKQASPEWQASFEDCARSIWRLIAARAAEQARPI